MPTPKLAIGSGLHRARRNRQRISRPRGGRDSILLVSLARDGAMFRAQSGGRHQVLADSAKDAVMECAALAWSRKVKDTVKPTQISARETTHGIFETRCFRGDVPAIEPDEFAGMKTIHFEDRGQDFLRWTITPEGDVTACEPFQAGIWTKAIVLSVADLKVGVQPVYRFPGVDRPLTLNYRIVKMHGAFDVRAEQMAIKDSAKPLRKTSIGGRHAR